MGKKGQIRDSDTQRDQGEGEPPCSARPQSKSLTWTFQGNNNLKLERGKLFIQTTAFPPPLISKPLGTQP